MKNIFSNSSTRLNTIGIVVAAYNEERQIKECLESAFLLTNNVVLTDTESIDKTASIAKSLGAKILLFPYSLYVEPSRKFSIEKVDADWVFVLDADERITAKLAEEIQQVITNDELGVTNYEIPRRNIFGQRQWLKHGGWWPDSQIRLIRKDSFRDWPKEIHSTPKINGSRGELKNPLIHFFHGDFHSMVEKTITYEQIESDLLHSAVKKSSVLIYFRKFAGELSRRLIKNFGFLDGKIGIIEAIYQAYSKTITYLFLYEKQIGRPL